MLALNPYPNPQLPLLTEDWTADGSKIYTYSDDTFPYAIHYVMFEPTDDLYGLVVIVDLTAIDQ